MSTSRGFYTFRVADLPADARTLAKVAQAEFVKQFGEDEADARAQTWAWLKGMEDAAGVPIPPITAVAVQFRPVTERKGKGRR